MRTYTASCCAAVLLVSVSLPLVGARAADEHEEHRAHPPAHAAPAHVAPVRMAPVRTAPAPALQEQRRPSQRNAEQNNERKAEMQERNAELKNERKAEMQERNAERQNGPQIQERNAEHQNGFNPQMQQRNLEHNAHVMPGAPGGPNTHMPFVPRPAAPPPLVGMQQVPFHQASPAPFLPPNLNSRQQAQAQSAQQNLQQNLYAIPASQAPSNYTNFQNAQARSFLNNYTTTLGGLPISINPVNTFVNPFPQRIWPSWYQPTPGWGFTNGFMLGSVASDLRWLMWGWPKYYGPHPTGFMYPTGYVPTPWVYVPWLNQWRQPGQMAYAAGGPPPEYTMPITVEAVEPMQIMAMSPAGIPVPQTINQMYMYNAYYYPRFGRWGYVNRQGYFIWVNAQSMNVISPIE